VAVRDPFCTVLNSHVIGSKSVAVHVPAPPIPTTNSTVRAQHVRSFAPGACRIFFTFASSICGRSRLLRLRRTATSPRLESTKRRFWFSRAGRSFSCALLVASLVLTLSDLLRLFLVSIPGLPLSVGLTYCLKVRRAIKIRTKVIPSVFGKNLGKFSCSDTDGGIVNFLNLNLT
jgi:hypothetical protein